MIDLSLERLVQKIPGLDAAELCENLTSLFELYHTGSLVALDGNRPVGFLSYRKVVDALSTRYGFALYQKRSVTELMLAEFLDVDGGSDFDVLVREALDREKETMYEDIVVTRNGEYSGLISIAQVLIEQRTRIALQLKELEQRQQQLEDSNVQLTVAMKELKAKEEQLVQTEKMASIGTLASGIAHDFNNMLGAILSSNHLLMAKLSAESPLQRYTRLIQNAAERSAGLTKQMLEFSQKSIATFHPVDLNAIVRETMHMLERSIGKEVAICLNLDDSIDAIEADDRQIQQVFLNLALNARDAMPKGGVLQISTASVILSSADCTMRPRITPGSYIQISVEDTGTGIPPEIISKIFDPFFSTKEVGKGTGLGLAVVYGILQRHKAHIEVTSDIGVGTRFTIFFRPCVAKKTDVTESLALPVVEKGEGVILVVDDEEIVRTSTCGFLESLGYHVLPAEGGEQALQLFRVMHDEIDLVILDMAMPGMDGRETFRQLRTISGGTRVLFLSGYSDEDRFRSVMDEGALGFVRKPFDYAEFSKLINSSIPRSSRKEPAAFPWDEEL